MLPFHESCLHELLGILLHGRFFSFPFFIYLIIYLKQRGLVNIFVYFRLYSNTTIFFFFNSGCSSFGSCNRFLVRFLSPFGIPPSFYGIEGEGSGIQLFENFPTYFRLSCIFCSRAISPRSPGTFY